MLRLAACLFALPLANAFRDSSPLVAWSPQGSSRSNLVIPEGIDNSLTQLLQDDALCSFESVVVIDQPGVRGSDLRSLHASSVLSNNVKDSPFSYQVQYTRSLLNNEMATAVEDLASRCGAQLIQFEPQHNVFPTLAESSKHIIYAQLASIPDGLAWERKQVLAEQEESLSTLISSVSTMSPNSLFVFTGSVPFMASELKKRQLDSTPFGFAPSNSTTTGGILARYQLLTPGLILTLAVAFFVALPIVFVGISALSQIQSPVAKVDVKGPSLDKKTQ
ncbi:hypothetical protein SCHPADRAFT_164240 [Schizopora paradoxa]|uniref:Protein BIG1 n=1 Tax=Schizopora paradoxa TaxID=27342 RepID=A0A0H2RZJ4_9AGAM|nr:hypothetical protein SCHPADRAFT_164240 [Schizopora paradoxa]